jgi:hypothetical protein
MGRWWDDLPREEWPMGAESEIMYDFEGKYGDRRQEVVFIGQFGNDNGEARKAVEEVLDSCLLTDKELLEYDSLAATKNEKVLKEHYFPTPSSTDSTK